VAVNPANPNNIAAIWIDHGFADNVAGVTLDGGKTWQNVALPLTVCAGGTQATAFDPWVSFAPNGDLHAVGDSFGGPQVLVNKSSDGGLTWTSPIQVNATGYSGNGSGPVYDDKPSLTADPTTADPTKPIYVYATWARFNNASVLIGNDAETMFARSTDGGQTWEPAQSIHTAPKSDFDWGQQIVVLPDGTLIEAFTEGEFKNNHQVALTLLRSTDHGQTWSDPITAVVQQPLLDPKASTPNALVTDPDTGQGVNAHPMFDSIAVDRTSGNLYAVWLDGRFSNFQYNGIALSMSCDGGLTWSQPIQVNQTPNAVPPLDRQAWNPTVALAADGTVAVTYYDFRNNTPAPGCATDYWLAYCHPSAKAPATDPTNWREVRLTDTSFNLEQAPVPESGVLGGSFWLGEYEGLAAAGKDFVAVWGMPNGSSTDQASIFFRRINSVGGDHLTAASTGPNAAAATLTSGQVNSLLPEAIHRWQLAGVDTSALAGLDLRIADLGGATLGMASGDTIWLDDNAAGWGWFVDRTPWDDAEFTTPGNQGEQDRMDLFTVVEHEVGHLLGFEHADSGVMLDTLPTATRRTPGSTLSLSDGANPGWWYLLVAVDWAGRHHHT
jgi:hypothetical protein